ncbi:MAG: hypothetical protein JWN86_3660 [Planctomycetota bacterium]|nr:hypothetical protein [Planctomycetota bacterium]
MSTRAASRWLVFAVSLSITACSPSGGGAGPTPPSGGTNPSKPTTPTLSDQPPSLVFRDVSDSSGIRFVHASGLDGGRYYPASLGCGLALFDYDGDGKLDIYFCSNRKLPLSAENKAMGNRLYRNLGGMKFEDVTDKAKVGFRGFCHGAAVADVNGDGKPDLYLTTYGSNVLYLNNGDGTFRDASAGSGIDVKPWSSGAAFLDYDGDGKLDLYVTRYARWTEAGPHKYCGDAKRGIRVFCSPYDFTPERHLLFRGNGDGTFVDTTEKAGVVRRDGRGLGVVAADINHDGKTDLYVANDGCPNFLFINNGDGTFTDATESSGAATNGAGAVQGSMGVDIQDVDGDGQPELFVTNFRGEYNTLYQNLGGGNFQDVSAQAGIVKDSLAFVGWGCGLADFDNDGRPDMLVANGEIDDNLRQFGQEVDFDQPTVVWRNMGRSKFVRVMNPGPFFAKDHNARGAAFGDLDDDGDLDVVLILTDGKPAVLSNESVNQGNWIRFALEGSRGNRDAIGATVEVYAGGQVFQRLVRGGDSYLSVNDRRALIGIGTLDRVDRVEILWPGGRKTTLNEPALKKTHRVLEPSGGDAR